MLKEIFSTLVAETENYLVLRGVPVKVSLGEPNDDSTSNRVYIAMQDYGIDPILKNRNPLLDDEPSPGPNYSHLISFSILPVADDYALRLQLIELLVELFEVRPSFQLSINSDEYELSISMKSASTEDFHQFWIARQKPAQPIVFFQARVSAI